MLSILFVSAYTLLVILGMGAMYTFLRKKKEPRMIHLWIAGLFVQLIFAHLWSFIGPLDFWFSVVNFALSAIGLYRQRILILTYLDQVRRYWSSLPIKYRLLHVLLVVFGLFMSAGAPLTPDNESYYIQTIKWLNEYGMVNGLGNLHPFLGQMSGWHVAQASFSFAWSGWTFNDLNGAVFILMSGYFLYAYTQHRDKQQSSFAAYALLGLVLAAPFLDTPSPDLPLILLLPVVIDLFVHERQERSKSALPYFTMAVASMIAIKVTLAPFLLVLLLYLWYRNRKAILPSLAIGVLAGMIFFIKNSIITGYPLYPLLSISLPVDWQMSPRLASDFFLGTKAAGWQINTYEQYAQLSFVNAFLHWIKLSGLHGLFNKLILISMLALPFLVRKNKNLQIIGGAVLLQFVFFYLSSPQYRFFLPILLLIGILVAGRLKWIHKVIPLYIILIIGAFTYNAVRGDGLSSMTNNPMLQSKPKWDQWSYILHPHPHSRYPKLDYKHTQMEGFHFYSPEFNVPHIYQTSDAPLPAANKPMLHYYLDAYQLIPILRGKDLDDGFGHQQINKVQER